MKSLFENDKTYFGIVRGNYIYVHPLSFKIADHVELLFIVAKGKSFMSELITVTISDANLAFIKMNAMKARVIDPAVRNIINQYKDN